MGRKGLIATTLAIPFVGFLFSFIHMLSVEKQNNVEVFKHFKVMKNTVLYEYKILMEQVGRLELKMEGWLLYSWK